MRRFASALASVLVVACSGSSFEVTPADSAVDTSTADTSVGDTSTDDTPRDDSASDTRPDAPKEVLSDAPDKPDSGGGGCDAGACEGGLDCCGGACVNLKNDPFNCGACGTRCSGLKSMCNGGLCTLPTCLPLCKETQQCCNVPGPGPSGGPKCVDGPTCPVGCPLCK